MEQLWTAVASATGAEPTRQNPPPLPLSVARERIALEMAAAQAAQAERDVDDPRSDLNGKPPPLLPAVSSQSLRRLGAETPTATTAEGKVSAATTSAVPPKSPLGTELVGGDEPAVEVRALELEGVNGGFEKNAAAGSSTTEIGSAKTSTSVTNDADDEQSPSSIRRMTMASAGALAKVGMADRIAKKMVSGGKCGRWWLCASVVARARMDLLKHQEWWPRVCPARTCSPPARPS